MGNDGTQAIEARMQELLANGVPAAQVLSIIKREFHPTPEQFMMVCEAVMNTTGGGEIGLTDPQPQITEKPS